MAIDGVSWKDSPEARDLRIRNAYVRAGLPVAMASPPTVSPAQATNEPRCPLLIPWYDSRLTLACATWVQQGGTGVAISGRYNHIRRSTSGGNAWARPVTRDSSGTGAAYDPASVNVNGGGQSAAVMFRIRDRRFVIHAAYGHLRIMVLNKLTQRWEIAQTLTDGDGATGKYIPVDFGTWDTRSIRIEGNNAMQFRGIYCSAAGTISAMGDPIGLRSILFGDSFGEGTGAAEPLDGYAQQLGHLTGSWDHTVSSFGATGIATGVDANRVNFRNRFLADMARGPYHKIYIQSSGNDDSYSSEAFATVITNLTWMLQQIRDVFAPAWGFMPKVFVISRWNTNGTSGTTSTDNYNAAVLSAMAAVPEVIPVANDNWIYWSRLVTGDGRSGAPRSGVMSFNAALVGATSGTLTTPFTGTTSGLYTLIFSDNTVKTGVTLTQNQTGVSWTGAVTAGASFDFYNTGAGSGNATDLVGGVAGDDSTHPTQGGHDDRAIYVADREYELMQAA